MTIRSLRDSPELLERAIAYFQARWASEASRMVYDDCLRHALTAKGFLPQWYLLMDGDEIAGCAGLIPNDFISRMDLMPWLCALYVEEEKRGHAYGRLLIERAKRDAKEAGFDALYLCSDHVGYYEKYGFARVATGYHPWGETSGVFEAPLKLDETIDAERAGRL